MALDAAIIIIAISLSFVAYIMVGYPLLLYVLSRRARPVCKCFAPVPVSVLIPVHNGEHYLRKKLDSVLHQDYPRELMEILVISDGSTDSTDDIAEEYAAQGVKLLRIPSRGKSAAVNAGIAATHNPILVLTDVRQELTSRSLHHMVACFADPQVGVVSGRLAIRKGAGEDEINIGLYWRYESWIRAKLGMLDSTMGATGPLYAIRRELTVPLPSDVLLDDVYLPLAAFFRNYRLVVEEKATALDYPTSLETEFRRKVRTLAGNYQLLRYYPQLLGPKNRMWLHYMSYKFGRLMMPYALLAVAISTPFLHGEWAPVFGAFQTFAYFLAAIDFLVPSGTLIKRITSPARTFVTMMGAAVCAVSVFFLPPRSLWKVTSATAPNALVTSAGLETGRLSEGNG